MNHHIKNIALIGIGGCGMNTLHQLQLDKVPVARFIAVNRDRLILNACRADKEIKLNAPKDDPEVIIKEVKKHAFKIREALSGMDAVVLVAGLGGMTGTYAAPEIARIGQGLGLPVWAVVVMPFKFEGERRATEAQRGFDQLKPFTVEIRQVKNQDVCTQDPNMSMLKAFRLVDKTVAELIEVVRDYKGALDTLSKDPPAKHAVLVNQVDLKAGQASYQKELSQKNTDSLQQRGQSPLNPRLNGLSFGWGLEMPRKSRFYVAGMPVHVVQRGNNRQPIFFDESGNRLYLGIQGVGACFAHFPGKFISVLTFAYAPS